MKDPRLAERVRTMYAQGVSKRDIIALFSASGTDRVELENIVRDLHTPFLRSAAALPIGCCALLIACAVMGYVFALRNTPQKTETAAKRLADSAQASSTPSVAPEQAAQENLASQELMLRCLKDPSYKLCTSKESLKR